MRADGPWWTGLPGTNWNDDLPGDAFAGALIAQVSAEHLLGVPPGRGDILPADVDKLAGQLCSFLRQAENPHDAYLRRVLVCIVCTGTIRPGDVVRALKVRYAFMRRQHDLWSAPPGRL